MPEARLIPFEDRVQCVARLGFTPRQAAFLVTVMLHSGVCIGRHYCDYARTAPGQRVHEFFRGLLARGYAVAHPSGHNRARVYHVRHKRLYRAIGEPDHRHRHALSMARVCERLMLLDAVLADRELRWLATPDEKLAYMASHTNPRRQGLAFAGSSEAATPTVRYVPDPMPIGVRPSDNNPVFLYLLPIHWPGPFRAFMRRHTPSLAVLPRWTVRIVVPTHMHDAESTCSQFVVHEFATALSPPTIDELRWYFERRQGGAVGLDRTSTTRYQRARRAFAPPRFQGLYRWWQREGEAVLTALGTPPLAASLASGAGRIETQVLPHRYRYLCSPASRMLSPDNCT